MIVARAEAESFAVNFERARSKEREMALGLWSPDPAFANSNPAVPQVGSVFGPKVMSIAGFAVLGLCVGALYNLNGGAASRAGAVIAPPAMVSTSSLGDVGLPSVAKMVPSILSVVEVPARPTGATLFPVSPEGEGKTAGEAGAAGAYRVRLFVPDGVSGPDRANAAERVATGDSTLDRIVPVDYPVRTTHVRFYHPADRGEAERIARLAGGEARDFTLAGVDPPEGYLELYLRGEGAED